MLHVVQVLANKSLQKKKVTYEIYYRCFAVGTETVSASRSSVPQRFFLLSFSCSFLFQLNTQRFLLPPVMFFLWWGVAGGEGVKGGAGLASKPAANNDEAETCFHSCLQPTELYVVVFFKQKIQHLNLLMLLLFCLNSVIEHDV